ncbi:hypothetical protein AO501_03730 [Mycobacterium gordonae]|uniref:GAF domain-containing protein n=1 Tax=Mycobacterium gordonae TaxID=1778 RepID=A0A0Q2MKT6_MYCGO|nr:hypothetical protein AO501_03730 [Mycobacterium gordonae]
MNPHPLPADLTTAVKLGGEMGRKFADFDWAAHPLGPPRGWAAEIRTTVANTLTSRSPTIVFLRAPELYVWHNDAYLSLMGDNHPGALGRTARELWWDNWDEIGPILTGVLSTGVATWSHGLMLPVVSESAPRNFMFAVNPVLGSDGAVSAVMAAATAIADPVGPAARERAEQSAGLMKLDAAVQGAGSVAGLLEAILHSPFASGDAPAAAIGVIVDGEDHLQFEFAGALPAELRDRYHVARLDSPLVGVDVIATGRRMVIPDTLELPARYSHAVNDTAGSVRACVAQPLRAGSGRVVGVLTLLWPQTRRFTDSELELFARTADITASALDRIRLASREHRIAVDFQEHLLDLDRGSTAAVVAAVYQPAGEAIRVGGDWFSATGLDHPDRIGVSVGDVVGHGLPAAIVMSRLRAAVTVSALTAYDPASVLGALDRYALTVAGARCATVAYAAIDTSVEPARISYLCAGHPYPLLVLPEQGPVYLEAGRRSPVATSASDDASGEPGPAVYRRTDRTGGRDARPRVRPAQGRGRRVRGSACRIRVRRTAAPDDAPWWLPRRCGGARGASPPRRQSKLRHGRAGHCEACSRRARTAAGLAGDNRPAQARRNSAGGERSRHQRHRARERLRGPQDGGDRGLSPARRGVDQCQ